MTTLIPKYDQGATKAINRPINLKLAESISVKDFGATGDGTTDDTAAVKAAVNAAAGNSLFFPAGTYIISSGITLPSNTYIYGVENSSILKIAGGISYSAQNYSIFEILAGTGYITIENLIFDGNLSNIPNISSVQNPMHVIFEANENIVFNNCRFQNIAGICLNFSTNHTGLYVTNCNFINCGGATDNSSGYRHQAIAFSNSTTSGIRSTNVQITGNYFSNQGLDCISIKDIDDCVVSNNIAENSYSLLYNNPYPAYTTNLVVSNNSIYNTNQGTLVSATPPNAIDLPSVQNCVVIGNTINQCNQAGIGIFAYSSNVLVIGNTLLNVVQNPFTWIGAISVGTSTITLPNTACNISNVCVQNNTIIDTNGTHLMSYGVIFQYDITNLFISYNNIQGTAVGKYGVYPTISNPGLVSVVTVTSNSQLTSSTLINDLDVVNGILTNWRKQNTLTGYYVNGTQVLTSQQAAIPNSADATVNAILAALRTHGLIAT